MNISAELLDQVEQHWRQRQQQQAEEQARQQKRRRLLRQQLITYAVVNAGLILLDLSTSGTITWSIYPLLGWGLGLLLGRENIMLLTGTLPATKEPTAPTTSKAKTVAMGTRATRE